MGFENEYHTDYVFLKQYTVNEFCFKRILCFAISMFLLVRKKLFKISALHSSSGYKLKILLLISCNTFTFSSENCMGGGAKSIHKAKGHKTIEIVIVC